jgi:hypothetical protein
MNVILVDKEKTERAGFEPAVRFTPYTRFPSVLDQPLRHLSINYPPKAESLIFILKLVIASFSFYTEEVLQNF